MVQRGLTWLNIVQLALIGIFFLPACAKKPIIIGRENPEKEIQQCITLSNKKKFKEAIECLEIFKSRFPKSQWGIEADLKIGDNYFRQKEYLLAADSYNSFIKLNPTHSKADYAYYKAGLSYLKQSPKAIDRDQEYIDDAIANFQIMEHNFPGSAYRSITTANLNEARSRVAKRHFYVANFYYRTGEYISAIPRFKEVADNFADSGLADKALYLMTLSNIELSKIEEAKVAYSRLLAEYPKSKYIKPAEQKMIRSVK